MADEDLGQYLTAARRLAIIALLALGCMIIVAAIDYKLKSDIVREADKWREEIRSVPASQRPDHWRQPRPADQRSPGPAVPDPNYSAGPGSAVGNAAGTAAQEDDRPPIPIVQPGNDSYRPPHRGAVNG